MNHCSTVHSDCVPNGRLMRHTRMCFKNTKVVHKGTEAAKTQWKYRFRQKVLFLVSDGGSSCQIKC